MFAHHPTRELFGGCPGRRAERHQAKFVRGRDDFVLRRESGGLAARLVARPGASPSRREAKFVRGRDDFVLRRESWGFAARLVAQAGAPSVIRRSLYAGETILYYGKNLGGGRRPARRGEARRRVGGGRSLYAEETI